MEDVEKLLKGTVEELDQLLNAKNVLGDPIVCRQHPWDRFEDLNNGGFLVHLID